MRWHVLTDDYPPLVGGVSTVSEALVGGLRDAGDDVVVWTRARAGLPRDVRAVRGRSFSRWGGAYLAAAVWPELRRGDRVLATTWPVASGLALTGLRGASLTVLAQGSEVTRPIPGRGRRVLKVADRVLGLSQFLAAEVGPGTGVLPAPINVADETRAPRRDWLVVARLTPLKGVDRVIRLAAAAGAHLVVVGDGPQRQALGALAAALGTADRTRFLGALPRSATLERIAGAERVWLLPRQDVDGRGAEGLGLVLLEAAARGVPTVGCRTGGVGEAVGTGLLLDDPDDVAGSLEALRRWDHRAAARSARAWLAAKHGVERAVAMLRG